MVDIHATKPLSNHPIYGPAKSGLVMLTRSLARDLAPEVRVNGIAPGMILWPEKEPPENVKEKIIEHIKDRRRYKKPSVLKKEKRLRAAKKRLRDQQKARRAQERRNRRN